jgi:hypothetical protein
MARPGADYDFVLQQAIRDSRARLFIHLGRHLGRLGAALSTACGELGR